MWLTQILERVRLKMFGGGFACVCGCVYARMVGGYRDLMREHGAEGVKGCWVGVGVGQELQSVSFQTQQGADGKKMDGSQHRGRR